MSADYQRAAQAPPMRQSSLSSSTLPPDFHGSASHYEGHADNFLSRRIKKPVHRKVVDYTGSVVRYVQIRMWQRDARDRTVLQPVPSAIIDMLPAVAYADSPATSIAAKFVHLSMNKNRCSINRVLWTPTGRRLITGSQSGEFTLWNGQSFNFEMILQAHEQAVRSMVWSHNENWMVTGDDGGTIKYWQTNMNNVKANRSAHKESVRDLSFSRTDLKFCSCSDDTTVKVWDFARCQEERSLSGHGWDVKTVAWHPTKSLLVSGGKDNLVKLWDAKSGKELSSFHGHKNTVLSVKWNQNGNWLLTASKDQIIKLYDVRAMKELESFRGHQKDVTALSWHPFHEEYFVSGSLDGAIFHWFVGHEDPLVQVHGAHENAVWDLSWHPIGYILCSGGHDHTTRFWCRNKPGDPSRDKYSTGYGESSAPSTGRSTSGFGLPDAPPIPGPFAPGLSRNDGTIPGVGVPMPLSHDISDQGLEQRPVVGPPPLPPGLPPAIMQQQTFQEAPSKCLTLPQPVGMSQQRSLPLPPPIQQTQSSHLPRMPHHLPRPLPLVGLPSVSVPQSIAGQMVMPGSISQNFTPLAQGHVLGPNPSLASIPSGVIPPPLGAYANGIGNVQGSSCSSAQTFSMGAVFSQTQQSHLGQAPGLNVFQPSIGVGANIGHPSGLPPPPPPPRHS